MKKAACIALGIASMHIVAMAQQRTPSSRAPDGLQIPEEVCRSGTGCVVVSRQSAGTDAQGRALWVVMTAPRGTRPGDEESARTELGCVPYVYWALATEGDRTVDRRRILDVCNDGYGAAGVGEDEVVVGPNRFEHGRSGGSSWRWGYRHVVSLWPFRLLESGDDGHWAIASNHGVASWVWDSRAGTSRWSAPWCEPDGATPEPSEQPADSPPPSFEANPFPEIAMPTGFAQSEWRTDGFADCASRFDGTNGRGFVLEGAASPGDAGFSVVAMPDRTLFVEIHDDRFLRVRGPGRIGDMLRIWTGPSEDYMAHCLTRQPLGEPWAIDVTNGRLISSPTGTNGIVIDRAEAAGAVRLRIVMPGRIEGITLAYSDSDDGRVRERTFATSALGADVATLGRTWSIGESAAVCEPVGGTLSIVQRPGIVERMVSE